jgi:predicted ArsR family transcriptional regulator
MSAPSSSIPALPAARVSVLDCVRRGQQTVNALAEGLGITDNAVRLQLSALERDGLLRRRGVRRSGKAGQPAAEYELTELGESALSRAYQPVLARLVAALGDRFDARTLRSLFADAGRRLSRDTSPAAAGSLASRAQACAALLESLGGSATIEGTRTRQVVIGAACPLASAVRAEPMSCAIVESLLAEHAGVRAQQRCQHGDQPRCRFELTLA